MHIGISIFLFISHFSLNSFASNFQPNNYSVLSILNGLNSKKKPHIAEKCYVEDESTTFKNCKNEKQTLDDLNYAANLTSRTLAQIETYYSKQKILSNPKHLDLLNKIRSSYYCIASKLKSLTIDCSNRSIVCINKNVMYHTLPFNFTSKNTIYFCTKNLNSNDEMLKTINIRAGSLIHEVAHLCGTNIIEEYDFDYKKSLSNTYKKYPNPTFLNSSKLPFDSQRTPTQPLSQSHSNSHKFSENYMYWAFSGFCLKGFDC